MKVLRRAVRIEDFLMDEESRLAYSYDASGAEGVPGVVLRPREDEQVRRILILANQHRLPVVPRGAGTGVRGGAVRKDAVILDLRGFDSIARFDHQRLTIDVGAGVSFARLRDALAKRGVRVPLTPANENATIGGLAAVNGTAPESFKYGDWCDIVERVECFDGLGRFTVLKAEDVAKVLGWEGATGVITKLRLRLVKEESFSLDLKAVRDVDEAVKFAVRAATKKPLAIEYLDPLSAEACGLPQDEHVLVAYEDETGSYRGDAARELWTRYQGLLVELWRRGFAYAVDVSLDESAVRGFVERCRREHQPCFGHLGVGVLVAGVRSRREAERCRIDAVALGGTPGGKWGFGRVAKQFAPPEVRKRLARLKEERDYNDLLNPGVVA